jgi:hypothetical protein
MNRSLQPQQELRLRRASRDETIARVIGLVRRTHEGELYGIGFEDASFDFWGIQFPTTALKSALFRVLLECSQCASREVVSLNEKQLEFLDDDGHLPRDCNACSARTTWRRTEFEPGCNKQTPVPLAPAAKPSSNRRSTLRARIEISACIRKPGSEEVVSIIDISRGGLRFRSSRLYATGNWVQVAVPFTANAANIFVPAQVVWQESKGGAEHDYGLKYVK